MPITIERLRHEDLSLTVFSTFNRFQLVTHCWCKQDETWVLNEHEKTREWSVQDMFYLLMDLHRTMGLKGIVSGMFKEKRLIGFSSVEFRLFGKLKEYVQLSHLHISYESRQLGRGHILFEHACEQARELGAVKLYISALCSQETISFYSGLGCTEAKESNKTLVALEPEDIQLEYVL